MNKKQKEPVFADQVDQFGNNEKIDITRFCIKLVCSVPDCSNIRYVCPQDRTQVTFCKIHARANRLRSRASRARVSRSKNKELQQNNK